MKNIEEIERLIKNANSIENAIDQFYNEKTDSRRDKLHFGFNHDFERRACEPVKIYLSSSVGDWGNSSAGKFFAMDPELFHKYFVKVLNNNRDYLLAEMSKLIKEDARQYKEKAEEELQNKLKTIQKL